MSLDGRIVRIYKRVHAPNECGANRRRNASWFVYYFFVCEVTVLYSNRVNVNPTKNETLKQDKSGKERIALWRGCCSNIIASMVSLPA